MIFMTFLRKVSSSRSWSSWQSDVVRSAALEELNILIVFVGVVSRMREILQRNLGISTEAL